MAAFSGLSGSVMIGVNHVADVTRWSADHEAAASSCGDSASAGWVRTWTGLEKITGSFEAKLQAGVGAPVTVGGVASLVLITGGGLRLAGNAVITRCAYHVDIDSGKSVTVTAEFTSTGEWSVGLM